jgi:hypothetical protein
MLQRQSLFDEVGSFLFIESRVGAGSRVGSQDSDGPESEIDFTQQTPTGPPGLAERKVIYLHLLAGTALALQLHSQLPLPVPEGSHDGRS